MKLLTSISVIGLVTIATAFMFITINTEKRVDNKEDFRKYSNGIPDTPTMHDIEAFEANLPRTKTVIKNFLSYPKDLNRARHILAPILGENNTQNGFLIQPSIYVKRFGRLGNNIVQFSNSIYLAEVMNISTMYIDKDFCYINEPFTTSKGIRVIPTDKPPKEAYVLELLGV